MAGEYDFQVYMKTFTKVLTEISSDEDLKLKSMLQNSKFVSQLDFYHKNQRHDFNDETYKHYHQEIKSSQTKEKQKADSLFKHSYTEQFESSLFPVESPFNENFTELNLWGLCAEEELNAEVKESKQAIELSKLKARCEKNAEKKWKMWALVLEKEARLRGLEFRVLCQGIVGKKKVGQRNMRIGVGLVEKVLSVRIRKVLGVLCGGYRKEVVKLEGIFREHWREVIIKAYFKFKGYRRAKSKSERNKKVFYKLRRIALKTVSKAFSVICEITHNNILKKLALQILILNIKKNLQFILHRFKKPNNSNFIKSYEKDLQKLKVLQRFSNLRQLKLETEYEKKIKKIFLLKITNILKILKFRAFINFKVTVKYLYYCMYSTEIKKEITLTQRHYYPLPDDLRLLFDETQVRKIERCTEEGEVLESFYTDDFNLETVLDKVEVERKLEKEAKLRGAGKYQEKDTQADLLCLEIGTPNTMHSPQFGTSNFSCTKLPDSKHLDFKQVFTEIGETPKSKRSKTSEPVRPVPDPPTPLLMNRKKTLALKKILIKQKLRLNQKLRPYFSRFQEAKKKIRVAGEQIVKFQDCLEKLVKGMNLKRFQEIILYAERLECISSFAKTFERVMIKIVGRRTKVFFEGFRGGKKRFLVEKVFFWLKNQAKFNEIKAFYTLKNLAEVKTEMNRFCSPLRSDYILTDIDSEENSRDYDNFNLMLAKAFKQDFEEMAKSYEKSIINDKRVKVLQLCYENLKQRIIFKVFKNAKKGEKLQQCLKKLTLRIFQICVKRKMYNLEDLKILCIVKAFACKPFFDILKFYSAINKLEPSHRSFLFQMQKIKNIYTKRVLLYIIRFKDFSNMFVLIKVMKKYLKFFMLRAFANWRWKQNSRALEKSESKSKTGTTMMKKPKNKVLRSGRNPPNQLLKTFTPILMKVNKLIFTFIVNPNQDLIIKKKALINISKIAKKIISISFRRWVASTTYRKQLKIRFSGLSLIFHKFFAVRFTTYKVNSSTMKKMETKIQKTKAKTQLRSLNNKKTGLQIINNVLFRFEKNQFAKWKNSVVTRKNKQIEKKILIQKFLSNLKKNFALCLKSYLNKWARSKPNPLNRSLALKQIQIFSTKRLHLYFSIIKSETAELFSLRNFKNAQQQNLKKRALKSIDLSIGSLLKVAFIRWINLTRLYKARLISDKQYNISRASKKLLAPRILKAFGSSLFLSFQNWKKFSELTKALPKSKVLVLRTGQSVKHLLIWALKKHFDVIVGKERKSVKNCLFSCVCQVKRRLEGAFARFKLNSRVGCERKKAQVLGLKGVIAKVLANRMLRPILRYGLGEYKIEMVMTLVKRTVLLSYKAELERFRINTLYLKTNDLLKEKESSLFTLSCKIFSNFGKKIMEKAFSQLKNKTTLMKEAHSKVKIMSGVSALKALLTKKLKPILGSSPKLSKFVDKYQSLLLLRILNRLHFNRYKPSIDKWKSHSVRSKISSLVQIQSVQTKTMTLQSLRKSIYSQIKKFLQTWFVNSKNISIRVKSQGRQLSSLLRILLQRTLRLAFSILINKKHFKSLIWVFDRFILKKALKRSFETLKLALYAKSIQINNNLWQLKMTKERDKLHKEISIQSVQGFSLSGLESLLRENKQNLKSFAFNALKSLIEGDYIKQISCKSGMKKLQMVYLTNLKRAFDKWNCQITWIPEHTMISYSISVSKLIAAYNLSRTRHKLQFFTHWKSQISLDRLQKQYACRQIKRLKSKTPNFTLSTRLQNALIQWRSLLSRNKTVQQLQKELEDTQLRARAYQKELQNLKKRNSFLYSGIKNV